MGTRWFSGVLILRKTQASVLEKSLVCFPHTELRTAIAVRALNFVQQVAMSLHFLQEVPRFTIAEFASADSPQKA